jgi:hypothetical protein
MDILPEVCDDLALAQEALRLTTAQDNAAYGTQEYW